MNGILAAFSNNNVVPSLVEGLQRMPFEDGEPHEITLATLTAGRIQQRQFVKQVDPEQDLSSFQQSLTACLTLACSDKRQESNVHLAATEKMAVAY
ncbi:MAG TPA: hypothetical protein EYP59_07955, partial [Thiotrichaceae bacterium]|nr:hypothetical protein [Thiotrichaceae bacterium]